MLKMTARLLKSKRQLIKRIINKRSLSNTKSIAFDGSDDYIALDSETNLRADFSISAWVAPNYTTYEGILGSKSSDDSLVAIKSSTDLRVRLHKAGGGNQYADWDTGLTDIPTDGSWTHIVVTKTGTTLTPYFNGTKGTTGTLSGLGTFKVQMIGGLDADNTLGYKFAGNIDEVAIWDTLLDDDAVTAIYNSGTPISLTSNSGNYDNSSDLVGWWRMGDGDTYSTIADNEGSNDGTMTNMASDDIEENTP
jgi:hypothetical protein